MSADLCAAKPCLFTRLQTNGKCCPECGWTKISSKHPGMQVGAGCLCTKMCVRGLCACACALMNAHTHVNTYIPTTCMEMSAVNEAKRDWASGKRGDIHACMFAEVTTVLPNGHPGRDSPPRAVFVSPELYVCSERNLRKQCTPARRPVP